MSSSLQQSVERKEMIMIAEILSLIGLCIFAYLCGSIPFGKIIGELKVGKLKAIDPQTVGSGNIGATNIFRTLGLKKGLWVGALDLWKGAIPVAFAFYFFPTTFYSNLFLHEYYVAGIVIICAMLGSMKPVWLKFKGGKGLGVLFGGLLMLLGWEKWLILMAIWLIILIFLTKKIMSAANFILIGGLPLLVFLWPIPIILPLSAPVLMLVLWGHKENLKRLFEGKEKPLDTSEIEAKIKDLIMRADPFYFKIGNKEKK